MNQEKMTPEQIMVASGIVVAQKVIENQKKEKVNGKCLLYFVNKFLGERR